MGNNLLNPSQGQEDFFFLKGFSGADSDYRNVRTCKPLKIWLVKNRGNFVKNRGNIVKNQ